MPTVRSASGLLVWEKPSVSILIPEETKFECTSNVRIGSYSIITLYWQLRLSFSGFGWGIWKLQISISSTRFSSFVMKITPHARESYLIVFFSYDPWTLKPAM